MMTPNYLKKSVVTADQKLMHQFLNELLGVRNDLTADSGNKYTLNQELNQAFEERYTQALALVQNAANPFSIEKLYLLVDAEKKFVWPSPSNFFNDFNGKHKELINWMTERSGHREISYDEKMYALRDFGRNLASLFVFFRYVLTKPLGVGLISYNQFNSAYSDILRYFAEFCKIIGCDMKVFVEFVNHEIAQLQVCNDYDFEAYLDYHKKDINTARVEQLAWLKKQCNFFK